MTSKQNNSGAGDKASRPKKTQPKATEPKAAKPKATEPKAAKPKATEPKAAKPKATVEHADSKPKAQHHPVRAEKEEHVTQVPGKDDGNRPVSHAGARRSQAGTSRKRTPQRLTPGKMLVVAAFVMVAFIASYNFAASRSAAAQNGGGGLAASPLDTTGGGGGGGGCCGGGGAPVEAATTVEGDVQKIAVDTSTGTFNPNVLKAKAGVPIEIDFSQSAGGCLSGVMFPDFGISEDLTGGGKTVKLPALEKGEYTFYCQMQMVSAKIVVE